MNLLEMIGKRLTISDDEEEMREKNVLHYKRDEHLLMN